MQPRFPGSSTVGWPFRSQWQPYTGTERFYCTLSVARAGMLLARDVCRKPALRKVSRVSSTPAAPHPSFLIISSLPHPPVAAQRLLCSGIPGGRLSNNLDIKCPDLA